MKIVLSIGRYAKFSCMQDLTPIIFLFATKYLLVRIFKYQINNKITYILAQIFLLITDVILCLSLAMYVVKLTRLQYVILMTQLTFSRV